VLKCLDYAGSSVADPSRGGGAFVLEAARTSAVLVVLGLGMMPATAQELTPRAYAPSPTGGNIVMLAYGRSTGEVLFDPVLPFDDVSATINSGALLYGRTFGLLGRSANAAVVFPYVWGEMDGFVEGEHRQVTRSGRWAWHGRRSGSETLDRLVLPLRGHSEKDCLLIAAKRDRRIHPGGTLRGYCTGGECGH
jgi:hypothetical protein